GTHDAAEVELQRALTDLRRIAPPRSLALADTMLALAELALTRRRFDEAVDWSSQALAIYEAVTEPDHIATARARFAAARADAGAARPSPAARALAQSALTALRGKSRADEAEAITAWLAR